MTTSDAPVFDDAFRARFAELLLWRRDVRRFRTDPLPPGLVDELLQLAAETSPSVGNCQPWRFVTVDDPARRAAVRDNFNRTNAEALAGYDGERAKLYASLKLAGLDKAPAQLAILCDEATLAGAGLGRRTMPEMAAYSVVAAITTLMLAARARGVGMGWLSILDPEAAKAALDVPATWRLVAYLCVGYPEEEHLDRELERVGWQGPDPAGRQIIRR